MALYYFDTSALVKYYVTEPGSTWIRQLIDETEPVTRRVHYPIFVTEITRVEVAAGLAAIGRAGRSADHNRIGSIAVSPANLHIVIPSFL